MIRTTIRGGTRTALRAMRFASNDLSIKAFLDTYNSIPEGDREKLPWEAIAIAAKVDVERLLGAIHFALQSDSVMQVKFIALSHYPSVMKKMMKYAKDKTGERDRAAINQAMGFTPSPKPPTFIGKAIFGAESVSDDSEEEIKQPAFSMEDNVNSIFPSSTDMQNKLIPIRQRLLEEGDK